jgi:tetratricopeptide (TPR) repeat protein
MSLPDPLQLAIDAARNGRNAEARSLLMDLVDSDPRNETAWIWLSGLMESLEDRIIACENALAINPENRKVHMYLADLQRQQAGVPARSPNNHDDLFNRAEALLERGDASAALELAHQVLEQDARHEGAWLMIASLSGNDVDRQIDALEKAIEINPANQETQSRLAEIRHDKNHPLDRAIRLESEGKFEQAIKAYSELAARSKKPGEFDHIYTQIARIERLQQEKIRHVSPASSVLRLTFGWLLLYLILIVVQAGLNPFRHASLSLWIALPLVAVGSLLLALAELPARHAMWKRLFSGRGMPAWAARLFAGLIGWALVILPHVLLVMDSLDRLNGFQIPAIPLF